MNWMGGARSRIKHSGDKKIKKQFFERKRLIRRDGHLKPSLQTPMEGKAVFSQDMKAFCLLENMHAKEMNLPNENLHSVRKMELDTKKNPILLHHSSLGPSPSLDTQSRLMFMEPKHQRDTGWKCVLPDRKRTESMETKVKAEGIGSNFQFEIGSSKRFNDSLKCQENPFISEDFQPTPVVKYLKDGNADSRGRWKREEKSSDLFPLPQTPALVRQKTFTSEGQHVAHTNTDFYQNFNQNLFFETPTKHNEPKRRKLRIEERCGPRQSRIPNRALFGDSSISDQGFVEGEMKQIEYGGSLRNVKGNSLYVKNSIFSNTASHSRTNDVHISIPKALPDGSGIKNQDNLKSCRNFSLDRLLDKKMKPCSSFDDIQRDFYIHVSGGSTSDKTKQDQFRSGLCTPRNPIITSNERNANDRESYICNIKKHSILSRNIDFCEFLDNSFEVSKQNHVMDEMNSLITSTPMERSRKHTKLAISPIPPISEKSPCGNLNEFHINHSVTEEAFSNADSRIPDDTMSMNKTVDSDTYCMDISVAKVPVHPSDTDIAEILAEINQLEEDQAKQGELSGYDNQTETKRDLEAIRLDDFTKNKYDALLVLQTAEAKLEEYAERYKVIDQGTIHSNVNLSIESCDRLDNIDEKQNPTQQTEESPTTSEFQPNAYKQNYATKKSASENCALQNQAILDNERSNANVCCTTVDTQKNADISFSGELEITLKADPQITAIRESAHQMSTSYTKDKICKCRDSFVLQSSRESQTEIVVESSGVQTERISSVCVGIQCDLFLDGCEGELEAPESQESFHSVVSELNTEITYPNEGKPSDQLPSRKKI